jgi:hypothetical protein
MAAQAAISRLAAITESCMRGMSSKSPPAAGGTTAGKRVAIDRDYSNRRIRSRHRVQWIPDPIPKSTPPDELSSNYHSRHQERRRLYAARLISSAGIREAGFRCGTPESTGRTTNNDMTPARAIMPASLAGSAIGTAPRRFAFIDFDISCRCALRDRR